MHTERLEITRGRLSTIERLHHIEPIDGEVRRVYGWDEADVVLQSQRLHFVACDTVGNPVGFVSATRDRSMGGTLVLVMWVLPAKRNQGFGAEMLAGLLSRIGSRIRRIAIEVPTATDVGSAHLGALGFVLAGHFPRSRGKGAPIEVNYYLRHAKVVQRPRLRTRRRARRLAAQLPIGSAQVSALPFGLVTAERICLRQANRFDAADIASIIDAEAVTAMQSTSSVRRAQRATAKHVGGGHVAHLFTVLDPSNESVIGIVTLAPLCGRIHTSTFFGLWLAADHRRRGLSREIYVAVAARLEELGVEHVFCSVTDRTPYLPAVLLGLGFEEVGYIPGHTTAGDLLRHPLYRHTLKGDGQPT
ncbi:MAG: hypothetical protein JWL72_3095 [Ilumatobacteraceae bacterium]|nr:hypothetical protein [Ilumatobacteraceae bacterium]